VKEALLKAGATFGSVVSVTASISVGDLRKDVEAGTYPGLRLIIPFSGKLDEVAAKCSRCAGK